MPLSALKFFSCCSPKVKYEDWDSEKIRLKIQENDRAIYVLNDSLKTTREYIDVDVLGYSMNHYGILSEIMEINKINQKLFDILSQRECQKIVSEHCYAAKN